MEEKEKELILAELETRLKKAFQEDLETHKAEHTETNNAIKELVKEFKNLQKSKIGVALINHKKDHTAIKGEQTKLRNRLTAVEKALADANIANL